MSLARWIIFFAVIIVIPPATLGILAAQVDEIRLAVTAAHAAQIVHGRAQQHVEAVQARRAIAAAHAALIVLRRAQIDAGAVGANARTAAHAGHDQLHRLAAALRDHGLVSHSVWLAVDRLEPRKEIAP